MKPLKHLFFLLVVLAGIGCCPTAQAANPIAMDVNSPLALTDKPLSVVARFRRWFPVAVTLSNTGDPVQGTLTLKLTSSSGNTGGTSVYTTPVDLPTVARKRVWLYGRLERGECDQAIVSFAGRGFTGLETRFDIRTPSAGTRIVLTVSDSDEKLSYLSTLPNRRLGITEALNQLDAENQSAGTPSYAPNGIGANGANPNQPRRYVQPLGKSHEWIPDRWIGLDAVDTLILQDFPHTALAREPLAALRGYVAGGGNLVVLGGANWQRLASSPLADLWPMTPTASTSAEPAETSLLVQNYVLKTGLNAGDRLGGAPVVMTRGTVKPQAKVEVGSTESPVLVSQRSGAGQVLFLTVDPTQPPFLGWSGLGELWSAVFDKSERVNRLEGVDPHLEMPGYESGQPNYGSYANNIYNGGEADEPTISLWKEMIRSPQLRTPPVSYIAWFLALYVFFLVPVNYCVLRYLDRRELAWVTVPVIVVAFSLMSYFAALRIKGSIVRTRHINIVQGTANSGLARADAMLWLFSPRKSTYTITGSDPQMITATYFDAGRDYSSDDNQIVEPGTDAPFVLQDSLINMWDYKTFIGQSIVNVGKGVTVRQINGKIEIVNGTPQNLQSTLLVSGGRVLSYGDLSAGKTASTVIASEDPAQFGLSLMGTIQKASKFSKIFPSDASAAYTNMANATLTAALGSQFSKSNPTNLLIAWSRTPVAQLTAQGEDPQAQDITLYIFRLPNSLQTSKAVADSGQKEINLKLVDVEPQSNKYSPQNRIYEGDFSHVSLKKNDGLALNLMVRPQSEGYGSDYRYNPMTGSYEQPGKSSQIVRSVEIWNWTEHAWQSVGLGIKAKQEVSSWRWSVQLRSYIGDGNLRASDRVLRLRVNLANSNAIVQSAKVKLY